MCDLSEGETFESIILDNEVLYLYVNPMVFPEGQTEIPLSIYQTQGELSVDWAKYQKTPESSFHIAQGKTRIVSITVRDKVRNPTNPKNGDQMDVNWHQTIKHNPVSAEHDLINGENISHSLIIGKKKPAVTEHFRMNSTWRDVP